MWWHHSPKQDVRNIIWRNYNLEIPSNKEPNKSASNFLPDLWGHPSPSLSHWDSRTCCGPKSFVWKTRNWKCRPNQSASCCVFCCCCCCRRCRRCRRCCCCCCCCWCCGCGWCCCFCCCSFCWVLSTIWTCPSTHNDKTYIIAERKQKDTLFATSVNLFYILTWIRQTFCVAV